MTDTSLAIQTAVMAALKAANGVTDLVGEAVYDRVPDKREPPYVKYGADQLLQDDADCVEGYEAFVTLHALSSKYGQIEVKKISGAVRAALHNAELSISGHRLLVFEHHDTQYLTDPDGLTSHGVIVFRALLDAE